MLLPHKVQVPRLVWVPDESQGAPLRPEHFLLRALCHGVNSVCNSITGALALLKQLQQIKLSPGPWEHVCAWSQCGTCHPPGLLSSPPELSVLGLIP